MNTIIQTWFPIVQVLFMGAVLVAMFWVKSTSKAEAEGVVSGVRDDLAARVADLMVDLKDMDSKVDKQDRRLIAVETGLKAFPTARDIQKLADKLAEVSGDVKTITQQVRGLHDGQERQETSLRVINETLMGKGHG